MTTRVGLVTCQVKPEPDPDEELMLEALSGAGLRPRLLAWDDPAHDPASVDLCVLRSCWNYPERPAAFVDWLERASSATRVLNPLAPVRWNLHKAYLDELAALGLDVVPTRFLPRGRAVSLEQVLTDEGWDDVVIKPSVSAGSMRTRRFRAQELADAQAFLDDLLADRDTMIQRYMPEVERGGERALVWIDGELTHAVEKQPRFDDDDEQVSGALRVSDEERELTELALSAAGPAPLLYARLDVFRRDDGSALVSELELVEPSLFLAQSPAALERFVAAVVGRVADPAR